MMYMLRNAEKKAVTNSNFSIFTQIQCDRSPLVTAHDSLSSLPSLSSSRAPLPTITKSVHSALPENKIPRSCVEHNNNMGFYTTDEGD